MYTVQKDPETNKLFFDLKIEQYSKDIPVITVGENKYYSSRVEILDQENWIEGEIITENEFVMMPSTWSMVAIRK